MENESCDIPQRESLAHSLSMSMLNPNPKPYELKYSRIAKCQKCGCKFYTFSRTQKYCPKHIKIHRTSTNRCIKCGRILCGRGWSKVEEKERICSFCKHERSLLNKQEYERKKYGKGVSSRIRTVPCPLCHEKKALTPIGLCETCSLKAKLIIEERSHDGI